jgi:hypothetical protein
MLFWRDRFTYFDSLLILSADGARLKNKNVKWWEVIFRLLHRQLEWKIDCAILFMLRDSMVYIA